jgi:AraC-like DNA-binding protein
LTVTAGDVLFLPENGDYNIMVMAPCSYICIDFSFVKKGLSPCVIKNAKNINKDFYKFYYNWINNSPTKIPRAFELINRIYCQLINSRNNAYSKSNEIFTKAVELILQHYKEPDFNVESLADRLNITTVHLRRVFSHNTSLSPINYINDIRLDQAKILLKTSNLTIGEIALSLGFTDQFHFSKSFKSSMGISPTEYRKNS